MRLHELRIVFSAVPMGLAFVECINIEDPSIQVIGGGRAGTGGRAGAGHGSDYGALGGPAGSVGQDGGGDSEVSVAPSGGWVGILVGKGGNGHTIGAGGSGGSVGGGGFAEISGALSGGGVGIVAGMGGNGARIGAGSTWAGSAGSVGGGGIAGGGVMLGSAGTGGNGGFAGAAGKPQCLGQGTNLRTAFAEDFERYSVGAPYGQVDSPWIQAVIGRDGRVLASPWAHSGAQSYVLSSLTIRSEVAYVNLGLIGLPRRVVIELWYTPNGAFVYEDFAELGLGFAVSRFDLNPAISFEVNDHVLEFRANPERPVASSNGFGGYPAAVKPPAQEVYNEVPYAVCGVSPDPPNCPAVHNYFRVELDFCADTMRLFAGTDANAALRGTGTFDGRKEVNSFYLAGGLNSTYIDDIVIQVDDG